MQRNAADKDCSPELIEASRIVSVDVTDKALSGVLAALLTPLQVKYELYNTNIILSRADSNRTNDDRTNDDRRNDYAPDYVTPPRGQVCTDDKQPGRAARPPGRVCRQAEFTAWPNEWPVVVY